MVVIAVAKTYTHVAASVIVSLMLLLSLLLGFEAYVVNLTYLNSDTSHLYVCYMWLGSI